MVPKKLKKSAIMEEPLLTSDIYSDTGSKLTDNPKSWLEIYKILEGEAQQEEEDDGAMGEYIPENRLKDLATSKIHKAGARPRLLPYTDMIQWALEHVDTSKRVIFNHQC
jgi:hypothetical protein